MKPPGCLLLRRKPPKTNAPLSFERGLWWAVIRQAARDLRYAHKSEALDALEFLRSTGLWLSGEMFSVPGDDYKQAVTELVMARMRVRGEPLL